MPLGNIPETHSKVMLGGKRGGEDLALDSDSSEKRVKLRDLLSILQCQEPIQDAQSKSSAKPESSSDTRFDLNVEDVSSSVNQDHFYESKSQNNINTRFSLDKNGFVSGSYGGIPKPRGRKSKNNELKLKIEQAKKERIDRFARIAAPTGLLNGLNPGIINHVRNGKQVRSIIQNLVKSEKKEVIESKQYHEDDIILELKLSSSSSSMVSEISSCLSNEESRNVDGSIDVLSVKGATVASEWLQLQEQDIKGRLAALCRSKRRVHAIITTELPSLLTKEFAFHQTNELHREKWRNLFTQMDSALSEEQTQLERWLEEVQKMQTHFPNNQLRSKEKEEPEKEVSMRAAAASIYSTCNFQSSRQNIIYCSTVFP